MDQNKSMTISSLTSTKSFFPCIYIEYHKQFIYISTSWNISSSYSLILHLFKWKFSRPF